jgi:hypothetical protein
VAGCVRADRVAGVTPFGRRRILRIRATHRERCDNESEDCLAAHVGECGQSRAPLVYVGSRNRQSVFQGAVLSDNPKNGFDLLRCSRRP